MSAELTAEQRAAVEAAGPVAITAGAGTGKTHTLGHRYVEHVVRGVSPLSIVAITFTKLAANELRARVRQYAEARLGEAHPALSELEAAPIGTVHALCFRIAQDFPDEAGVPPNVRLLDPLEGDIWRVDALTEVMRNLPPEAFEHLPYDQLERILKVLLENPHEAQQALQHEPAGALRLLAVEVATLRQEHLGSDAFGDAFATLQGLHSEHEDKLETLRKDLIAAVRLVEQGSLAEVEALLYRRRSKVGTQKVWGDALLPLQAACDTVLKAVRDYVRHPLLSASWEHADDVFKAAYPHVRRAFTAALERIEAAKTRGGVLDFSDIERAALRALEHPHVREHYARRWSVLLLDEAQDTSPIQDALIAHLAAFTTLTVVGDAKQSIYRFRGADPAVFARMQQRVHDAQGQAVQLQVSFRSRAPLVASVNTLFEDVLGDAHEPLMAAALDTDAQHTDASLPAVSAWSTTLDEERPSAARLGLAEAHRIAEELSQLLSSGRTVRGKDGVPRPVKASDVAVLARSWTTLDTISEILPAYGVPVLHGGGGNLLETPEARDGIAALRFAADPRDDVALLALLRGPMFTVPDPDLLRHRDAVAELKPASFWDGLQATPEASLKEAAAQLDSWLQGAATLPPTDLLADLDERTGWSGVAANLPGGPRRLADRAGFVSLVASLERSGLDVFAVARRLRRLVELNVDVARPKLQAGNAVTLMSVHGSKGLEWPVVVLAGMDRASSGRAPDVIVDHERGVAFAVATHAEYRAEPVLLKVLKHREQQAAEAEARRLWYVAVTRAADWVVFSHGPKANYDMKLFADGLEDIGAAAEVKVVPPGRARWPEGAAGGVTYDGVELPEPTLSAQEK